MKDKKIEILLVDDEAIVGNRLKPALTKSGYQVEVFENPKEALQRIDQKEFDIIVSDIMMTDVSGIQLLEYAQQKTPRTKVIMITGYATEALAREAMAKGAFDIISKPFRPDDLRAVIAKAKAELGLERESEE